MPSKQLKLSEYTKWQLNRLSFGQLKVLLGYGVDDDIRSSHCEYFIVSTLWGWPEYAFFVKLKARSLFMGSSFFVGRH
jgi:hypothetical protein